MRALLRARRRELFGLTQPAPLPLSVVIPTLNAARSLEACVDRLAGVTEIIVADGGSCDGTQQLSRELGANLVEAPRGRGLQLAAGVAQATGDWLLILHADTLLDNAWREAVMRHVSEAPDAAAFFRFQLDDASWQARLIERAVALRVQALALPYGDQGLLISNSLYDEVGGYQALPLMEDVDLIRRIGRSRLRALAVPAITSAERWRKDGWWRRSARNLACLSLYELGVSPERIARLYA